MKPSERVNTGKSKTKKQKQNSIQKPRKRRILTQQTQPKNNQQALEDDENCIVKYVSTCQSATSHQIPSLKKSSPSSHKKIQQKIIDQIFKGKLNISSEEKKLPLLSQRYHSEKTQENQINYKQKLKQMQFKKMQTLQMLRMLQTEQRELRKSTVYQKRQKQIESLRKSRLRKERSFYSPDQKEQVKRCLKRNLQLQKQLRDKTLEALLRYQQMNQQEQQNKEKYLQQQRVSHRLSVEENLKKLQQRKLRRLQFISMGNKKFKEVKSKKYLHQSKELFQRRQTEEQRYQTSQKIHQIKEKMRKSTALEIKQHLNRYNQIVKSRIAEKESREKSLEAAQVKRKKKLEENYFTKIVKTQILNKKQFDQQSRNRPFELKKKVKQFEEHFKKDIKPKIRTSEESRFVPNKHQSVHTLTYQEQLEKGKQYLNIARKLKKCESKKQEQILSSSLAQEFEKNKASKIAYKNYLKQIRRQSFENPETSRAKFDTFLKKQGFITEYNSLNKAFMVAQSIEAKSKKSKDQKLIDSVQNKINLLRMLA